MKPAKVDIQLNLDIKRRANGIEIEEAARGHEFYLRVLKVSLTSERSERVRNTFSTRR